MLRALATWIAKWKYVWNKEIEAGLNTWSARVAERNAEDTRVLLVKLKTEADTHEARIKEAAEMEKEGFYLCENGHEKGGSLLPEADGAARKCMECNAPVKYIKRSEMNGQELYEWTRTAAKLRSSSPRSARKLPTRKPKPISRTRPQNISASKPYQPANLPTAYETYNRQVERQ
jgi:hypothetical protein